MKQTVIIGPPGTGKTTRLLRILNEKIQEGVPADRIAFVSFTREGAYGARDRVVKEFGLRPADLPYFRTLHSLAFRRTGTHRDEVMDYKHWKELSKIAGMKFTGKWDVEETAGVYRDDGDYCLFLDGLARNLMISTREVWERHASGLDWSTLDYAVRVVKKYKNARLLIDFTDMVERFIREARPVPVDVAIIDEAQDNTTLQWAMSDIAFSTAREVFIAGDDDQTIYKWSGADVERFLSLKGEMVPLKQSYRLPKAVFDLSQTIAGYIKHRFAKQFHPRHDPGVVSSIFDVDGLTFADDDETWMLLARNRYLLKGYKERLEYLGLAYTYRLGGQTKSSIDKDHAAAIYAWERARKGKHLSEREALLVARRLTVEIPALRGTYTFADFCTEDAAWFEVFVGMRLSEREYYRSVLQRGVKLYDAPRIHVDTIHGVKGGEADNVALMLDMSYKTYRAYERDPDDEHRVFYVGITRAKKRLILIEAQTERAYRL